MSATIAAGFWQMSFGMSPCRQCSPPWASFSNGERSFPVCHWATADERFRMRCADRTFSGNLSRLYCRACLLENWLEVAREGHPSYLSADIETRSLGGFRVSEGVGRLRTALIADTNPRLYPC